MCRYEEELAIQGRSRNDIRPPRFKESGNPDYPAGSKDVACELCPMKRGIFKQTVAERGGSRRWAHVVCALWQTPEMTVAPVNQVDAVCPHTRAGCARHSQCADCVRSLARSVQTACGVRCRSGASRVCGRRRGA
jgi:hypothetical protein